MEKRQLGTTGIYITALGFGAMELRDMEEKEASVLLNKLLDSGINYVDTSPCYGPSEQYIGNAISHRRKEYFLASKCGCILTTERGHSYDRKTISNGIENSLKLMKTDYLDVVQLHSAMPKDLPDGKYDDAIQTMLDFKKAGKIRSTGISFKNGRADVDPMAPDKYGFLCIKEFMDWGVFDVMQIVYGCMPRSSELAISKASERGIGLVARGVVKNYKASYNELYEKAGLGELCGEGEDKNTFFIRYAMSHPGLSTMIIGTSKLDHLAENIKSVDKGKLPDDIYAEAKKRLDSVGVTAEII